MKEHKIKSILTVASGTGLHYTRKEFNHKIVDAYDMPSYNLGNEFKSMSQFIAAARAEGHVLVHCMAGVSRSSTAVLAYMIEHLGMPLSKALHLIRARRPIISPNYGFLKQLERL